MTPPRRPFGSGNPPQIWQGDQGVAGLRLPDPSGMPVGPTGLRSGRFRARPGDDPVAETFNPANFAKLNGEIVVIVPTASIVVLPGPSALRNFLGFRNSSATAVTIFVAFGTDATLNSWLRLTQNTVALFDVVCPQDTVYAIAETNPGLLTIVQSTTPGATS